jgi:hypothetical protein
MACRVSKRYFSIACLINGFVEGQVQNAQKLANVWMVSLETHLKESASVLLSRAGALKLTWLRGQYMKMWRSVLCYVGVLCKIQYLLSNFSCDSCLTYKIYSIGYIIYLMRYFALYIPLGNLETPCSSCWHTLRSFLAQSMVRNQD